jgi:hypothetical protein
MQYALLCTISLSTTHQVSNLFGSLYKMFHQALRQNIFKKSLLVGEIALGKTALGEILLGEISYLVSHHLHTYIVHSPTLSCYT